MTDWPREKQIFTGALESFASWCKESSVVTIVDRLGRFAVVFALIQYLVESNDRATDRHNRAWSVIDSAHGLTADAGRKAAIASLMADGVSLLALQMDSAVIDNWSVPNTKLDLLNGRLSYFVDPSFIGSSLKSAFFEHATFIRPDFRKADLSRYLTSNGVDLTYSYMVDPQFASANLESANFTFSNIVLDKDAVSIRDILRGADLTEAVLNEVNLIQGSVKTRVDANSLIFAFARLCRTVIGNRTVNRDCTTR